MSRYDEMAEATRGWQPPLELQRSTPREIELSASAIAMLVFAAVFLLGGIAMAIFLTRQARLDAERIRMLDSDGATTEGTVTRRWRRGGKSDRRLIAYEFHYNGSLYHGESETPRRIWAELTRGGAIVVRFLPSNPSVNHPAEWEQHVTPQWLPFLLPALFGIPAVIFLFVIRRHRALLAEGRAAPAVVTRFSHAQHGKMIHYEFALSDGSIGHGKAGPTRKLPDVGSLIPILYDPENPRRSAPYPMCLARIAGAPRGSAFRNRRLF